MRPALRHLGVAVAHRRSGYPRGSVIAARIALLVLGAAGCDQGGMNPVSATSTTQGVSLSDVNLADPRDTCRVSGVVHNGTDKVLTAMALTAVGPGGSAIGTVRIDVFHIPISANKADTVQPRTSYPFDAQLNDLQGRPLLTCSGIERVDLTEVIFE